MGARGQPQFDRFRGRRGPRQRARFEARGDLLRLPPVRKAPALLSEWQQERRRLEQRVQHAQQSEMIGQLTSGVAHDLNVILMAILGNADLLSVRTSSEDPRQSYIDEIRSAVTRGSGLARRLSVFNRQLRLQSVDVNRLIDKMTPPLSRLVGSGIAVTTRLSPERTIINADPSQLEQVLLNLTINARDTMPDGGQITIETAIMADPVVDGAVLAGDYLRLSVSDTGCGISAETKACLADPLSAIDEDACGGLGIATVHAIVARHGGVLQGESVKGQGSTFHVFLPSGEALDNEDAA